MSLNILSKLFPQEIIILIFEFNPEHREKMKDVFQEMYRMQRCDICESIMIKYIYCRRGSYSDCCSLKCVDIYENQ
jgi:hypothetical protein